jgi:hypothetical protein
LLSTSSVSGEEDVETPDSYYTSEIDYEVGSTQFGLMGSGAATLGVLINDRFDLGTRLSFRTGTTTLDINEVETTADTSEIALDPYLAVLTGARGDTVRVALGGTAGIGSGSQTDKNEDSSENAESSTSTTRLGALFGLRLFPSDMVSVDPTLLITKTWLTMEPEGRDEVELSGMSAMLTLGVSFWMGGAPRAMPAPIATASELPPPPVRVVAQSPAATETRPGRTSITLEEGRVLGLIVVEGGAERSVKLILRESLGQANFLECESVVLHGPYSDDISVETVAAKAGTATNSVPVLRGQLPIATFSQAVSSHSGAASVTPEHWIDVCGARWYLYDGARNKIVEFLRTLPQPPATTAPAPASVAPAPATEPSSGATPAAVPPPSDEATAPAGSSGPAL